MISKKNSALIFYPQFYFFKKYHKQTRILLLPFKKHEIFGGVAHVSHLARKLTFIWQHAGFSFSHSQEVKGVWFFMKKYSQNSAWLVQKIIWFINFRDQLGGPGTPAKSAWGTQRAPWNFPESTALQSCSYWKYDTLHAIVECGIALFEDISKGMQILVNYPILLTYMVVIIDVSFVLSSKGTLVCNSSSSVLVLNRTSPSLLQTLGNLRWRRFRGDGDRTSRESLELRQPSLPVKNRPLRWQ